MSRKEENLNPIITFEGVTKQFANNFIALDDINLEFAHGEFISVVGQSGAGKSTLLKMIYAEEHPTEGTVYFKDRPLDSIKKRLLPFYRRNIGAIFQDYKLLNQKTIFENVAYTLEVYGRSTDEIFDEVPQVLELVGLEGKTNHYPEQLSGGEQQRVSIARALIHRPKIIVADEPTGNLDPISTEEIMNLLLKINEFGTTVVLATHDKDIVDKINRRVIVMENGKVIKDVKHGKYSI